MHTRTVVTEELVKALPGDVPALWVESAEGSVLYMLEHLDEETRERFRHLLPRPTSLLRLPVPRPA